MIGRMHKEYASLRRRTFLAPVWIFALLGLLALGIAVWAVTAASTTAIIVMRHAERASDPGLDPPLTASGIERAERLAAMLGGASGDYVIDAIFVTQWQRTAATARPLAIKLQVPVITLPAEDLAGLERRIYSEYRGRRVLVIAHSDSVPEIAARLSGKSGLPPIAADEYGTVYVIAVPRWGRPLLWRLKLP